MRERILLFASLCSLLLVACGWAPLGAAEPPWVRFHSPRVLIPGSTEAVPVAGAIGVALAQADFEGDSLRDLVVGYRAGAIGVVAVYRGTGFPEAPFQEDAVVLSLPESPEFLAAADLDADGYPDVLAATRGGRDIWILRGDGRGGFRSPYPVALPGAVSALAVGDINRRDGLPDVLVTTDGTDGPQLLAFEGPHGAFESAPEVFDLAASAMSVVTGQLDLDCFIDVAVSAGQQVVVLHGRDRRLAVSNPPPAVPPAPTTVIHFEAEVVDLAYGRELNVLCADGTLASIGKVVAPGSSPPILRKTTILDPANTPTAALVSAKVSTTGGRDVLVVDPTAGRTLVLAADPADPSSFLPAASLPLGSVSLPLRLNHDGLDDLVVLSPGNDGAPAFSLSAPRAGFVVNVTTDANDASPGDGACDVGAGNCSLRAALQEANALASADAITFALGAGTPVITPGSALPAITDVVSIDGATGGATRIELNGGSAGATANGLRLAAGSSGSAIRSLVIQRFRQSGIRVESADNVVADCYLGPDATGASGMGNTEHGVLITGSAATGNTIGGPTAGDRNVISANDQNGVQIDGGAAGNQVHGNYIGLRAVGTIALANNAQGVVLSGAAINNDVGASSSTPGTPPGNVISGNQMDGIRITGAGTNGNLIAGNLLGTDGAGTAAVGNRGNGVTIEMGAQSNTVGGTTNDARNVISGQNFSGSSDGVEVRGVGTDSNAVYGNFIGTAIDGATALENNAQGVLVSAGARFTIVGAVTSSPGQTGGNVISGNGDGGVAVVGTATSDNSIQGNLIGMNAAGTVPLGNSRTGVEISDSPQNTIGGSTAMSRNVISGQTGPGGTGVDVNGDARDTVVQGNYIGVDLTGTVDVGNGSEGVSVQAGSMAMANLTGIRIGGPTSVPGTPPGNVISGNGNVNVHLSGEELQGAVIAGNIIGLDASGTVGMINGNGIVIDNDTSGNVIGGATTSDRNVISRNSIGVSISGAATGNLVRGNYIGTDITGTVARGNVDGIFVFSSGNTIGGPTATAGTPPGNVISGNDLASHSNGIEITGIGVTGTVVRGNIIGLNAAGNGPLPNADNGVFVGGTGSHTIGGPSAGDRNVISGNNATPASDGIQLDGTSNNVVRGNWIGLTLSGTSTVGNGGDGILISDVGGLAAATGNSIGGSGAGDGNVIGGNTGSGVRISGTLVTGNTVAGNRIGVLSDGVTAVANLTHGVVVTGGASSNTIGGTSGLTAGGCTGACNVIARNALAGVAVDAAASTAVSIRGNALEANGGLGIDLGSAGVTANDPGDPDAGANNLQNFPVVQSLSFDGVNTTVSGTLNTTPSTAGFVVEVFENVAVDPTTFGEGRRWLGAVSGVTTDSAGNVPWMVVVPGPHVIISATATAPGGSTSEFSRTLEDGDGDGVLDGPDNCPFTPNPGQADLDGDGEGDACDLDDDGDGAADLMDCAPLDAGAFAMPGEIDGFVFTSKTAMQWVSAIPAAGSATVHDLPRSDLGQFPVVPDASDVCVAAGTPSSSATDGTTPGAGAGFYYLVRGRNACGAGTYGFGAGGERQKAICP